MNLKDLRADWIKTMGEAEAIRLKYDGKPKDMPGDEEERWLKALDEADKIQRQITGLEREEKGIAWSKEAEDKLNIKGGKSKSEGSDERKAFLGVAAKVLRGQARELNAADIGILKSYQADDMAGGGFFVTPMELAEEILTLLKDEVFVRSMATVFPLATADTLGIPAIDTDPSDTDWTTELRSGNEELTANAGRRELKPNPMAKRIKISKALIRKAPNFQETILDRLVYKAGITEEKAFLVGSGAQQPLGVFTADTKGISTARDVTAAGANAIAGDDFIAVTFKLKASYRKRASWILNRTVLQAARKLKDSNNNYIWSTGLGPGTGFQGVPPTLLGLPYNESEYAPGTITTGLYTAILGAFEFYWIADALNMEMQVLDQLYAENNQMGYILRKETDGMPVLEEAFARLKQA